ncbi:hypothetical protein BH20CHL6_BH20CHL6_18970 [soil metagenome]
MHAEASGATGVQVRILAQLAEVVAPLSTGEASAHIGRAIDLARTDGDRQATVEGLSTRAYFQLVLGDHASARGPLEEAVSLLRQEPGHEDLTFALLCLAQALARAEDQAGAVLLLKEALALLSEPDGPISAQFFSLLLAATLAALGDGEQAMRLLGAADAAATANAVPFQRLEQVLRWRVLRAALREGDARAVRAAAKEGCSTGCEQAITDLRRTRWGLSGASPADQPAGWEASRQSRIPG